MTRTQRTTRSRRRRTAALGMVSAAAALSTMIPSSAWASTRVASPAVGATADQALDALERWQASGTLVDYAEFLRLRSLTASLTVSGMGLGVSHLGDAWGTVSIDKQRALLAAISQLGVPYRSMKSEEGKAFDCSGLIQFAFGEAGIDLPRSSRDQIRETAEIEADEAEPGDLIYYPGHISMYLGEGLIVHSPFTGSEVEVRRIFDRSVRFGDVLDGDVETIALPGPAAAARAAFDTYPVR